MREGFLNEIQVSEVDGFKRLRAYLKTDLDGSSIIQRIERMSKPGRRMYLRSREVPKSCAAWAWASTPLPRASSPTPTAASSAWAGSTWAGSGNGRLGITMSRIGKQPVAIPSGVEVSINGQTVTIKGKQGTLTQDLPGVLSAKVEENQIVVERQRDDKSSRALHGLMRSLLKNHVIGVTDGYKKELEIHGVSYQASATPRS